MSGATKGTTARHPTFCLTYWLLGLDGHVFVLALLELLTWPLVKRSPRVKGLLSASLDASYERC